MSTAVTKNLWIVAKWVGKEKKKSHLAHFSQSLVLNKDLRKHKGRWTVEKHKLFLDGGSKMDWLCSNKLCYYKRIAIPLLKKQISLKGISWDAWRGKAILEA